MAMKFMKFLEDLKKLKLPADKFAVFGSGAMAIRGIRDSNDLDIIVKKDLWEKIDRKYMARNNQGGVLIGEIDVAKDWLPYFDDVDELIDTADVINGVRFVKLEHVLKWKKAMAREKDKKDVKLIEEFLKKQPQQ